MADTTERFLTSEIIREKCITRVGDEIPYRISVMIDSFKLENDITHIDATLFVEKKSQKGIVIGQGGKRFKIHWYCSQARSRRGTSNKSNASSLG